MLANGIARGSERYPTVDLAARFSEVTNCWWAGLITATGDGSSDVMWAEEVFFRGRGITGQGDPAGTGAGRREGNAAAADADGGGQLTGNCDEVDDEDDGSLRMN